MSESKPQAIVIKRIKKIAGGHHGGAWKIAYADFVTAMMAFFLLMWLLSALNKYQLQGIAQYFKTPLSEILTQNKTTGKIVGVNNNAKGDVNVSKDTGQPKLGDRESKKLNVSKEEETKEEKDAKNANQKPQEKQNTELNNNATVNIQTKDKTPNIPKAATASKEQPKNANSKTVVVDKENEKDLKKLEELKKEMEKRIHGDPDLTKYEKQIKVDITAEGLRIRIMDNENRPMFGSGSSSLEPQTKEILSKLVKELNSVPNKILISGNTDAKPYAGGESGYSNWELSVDRANATRRELVNDGIAEDKVLRISGLGSTDPLDKKDPLNPINRRITIILLNQQTAQNIKSQQ